MKLIVKPATCNLQPAIRSFKILIFFLLLILLPTTAAFSQEASGISNTGEKEENEQAISLLGKPLYKPELSAESKIKLNADYEKALEDFRARPGDPDAHIWLGRRLAYLGEFQKAIRTFSEGIHYFPDDPRFLRHRGHRYITTRKFDLALTDLEKAAGMTEGKKDQVEPDGAPNSAGIPVSSLHSNIWYHLGLTNYLLGDLENAFIFYSRCILEADNDDKRVSSGYWLYLISLKLGDEEYRNLLLGEFKEEMNIIENFAYHEMLMFYKSGMSPEKYGLDTEKIMKDPTRAYGLGLWYFFQNDDKSRQKGIEIFRAIIELPSWPSFGYIAAEAELARFN